MEKYATFGAWELEAILTFTSLSKTSKSTKKPPSVKDAMEALGK